MTDGDERKQVLDYTYVDLHYMEDQRKNMVNKFNVLKQELSLHNKVTLDQLLSEQVPRNIVKALGGRGRRKEKISSKEVVFTKADESSPMPAPKITSNSESECNTQEPLPPLPKMIGADPTSTLNSLISLADLTSNMADLTLNTSIPKKEIQTSNKVRGKGSQKVNRDPLRNHLSDDYYLKPKCSTCGSTDHLTKEHPEQVAIKKTLIKLKAQSPLNPTPKKAPWIPKPFSDCKYFGFNNHHFDDYEYYPRSIIVKRHRKTAYDVFIGRSPDISYFYVFGCPMHIHNHKDHLGKFDEKADDGFFLGYYLVAKVFRVFNIKRQEMEDTYHVTFSEDDEVISQSNTKGDAINFNENRSFSDDEFLEPRNNVTQCSRNIKYFPYIPTYETIHENITPTDSPILQDYVSPVEPPEFTSADDHPALNEHDHSKSADILEPTEIKDIIINEPISNVQPSPTISPSAKGEPLDGITTRSRIRNSKAASTHECMYVNFLSKMESKKQIEALEEEGWIISMQEELNQFERNKV
ncbi:retrovirus-related pol polyprotein from transposon TNT 1-94 [Tanacetum coccineum]